MGKPMDLTPPAKAGYRGEPNPHIQTSPNYYAHELGKYLHDSGRIEPEEVRMSRGDSIRSRDNVYAISDKGGITSFERLQ